MVCRDGLAAEQQGGGDHSADDESTSAERSGNALLLLRVRAYARRLLPCVCQPSFSSFYAYRLSRQKRIIADS
jgi:hypothetical protein